MSRHRRKRTPIKPIVKESEKDILGEHLSNVFGKLLLVCSIAILVSPAIAYYLYSEKEMMVFILVVLITSPMTYMVLKYYMNQSWQTTLHSFKFLIGNRLFNLTLLYVTNIFVLLFIGFNTLIPTHLTICLYIFMISFPFLLKRISTLEQVKKLAPVTPPTILSIFFLINYIVSFNATTETYHFSGNYEVVYSKYSQSGSQKTTLITLENNTYQAYYGIRMFCDFDEVNRGYTIKYYFKTGLFGIRVLKDFAIL
jgi:hypothetical protein